MQGRDAGGGVRQAAVAGSWYPDDALELRSTLEELLAAAAVPTASADAAAAAPVCALVVPHAALRYSGATAACAFARLPSGTERVVVLAPSHRTPLRGAAVDPSSGYATPLGVVAVDTDAVELLAATPSCVAAAAPFTAEHAIEMELPFVQLCAPRARVVPMLIGEPGRDAAAPLVAALRSLATPSTVFVVSSDFVHYGPRYGYVPFDTDVAARLRTLDGEALEALCAADAARFDALLRRTNATICGRRPLALLLHLLPAAASGALLCYTTSGEITGDWQNSVSYAALAFTTGAPATRPPLEPLTSRERAVLLVVARQALEALFMPPGLPARLATLDLPPRVHVPSGVFVSLHRRRGGRLRGCIGALAARVSLVEAVAENARRAATEDPRFQPLGLDELADIEIELSVLGPLLDVDDPTEIVVGRDGVVVTCGLQRAVLLPQVAPAMNWTREALLDNVCCKAGLAANAWRHDAVLQRFEAEVFVEPRGA